MPVTTQMIMNFITERQMSYIWEKIEVLEGNWVKLNEIIWKKTFNTD